MKKAFFAAVVLVSCILSSCGKEKNKDGGNLLGNPPTNSPTNNEIGADDVDWVKPDPIETGESLMYYPKGEVDLFCPGEDGMLYTYSRKGEKLFGYDADGKLAGEYPLKGQTVSAIYCQNEKCYYIDFNKLYGMDFKTGTPKVLAEFDGDFYAFRQIVGGKDGLFILRKSQYREDWEDVRFLEDDEYVYEGEELLFYSFATGKLKRFDIPNIKQIIKNGDGGLLVYAYDGEGGFYFAACGTDGELGEKQYTQMKLGAVLDIAYDDAADQLVCTDTKGVFVTTKENASDRNYILEEVPRGLATLFCSGGFTYGLFSVDGTDQVIRMEHASLIHTVPALNACRVSEVFLPPYYGYTINYKELTVSEMAMVLLAGDSDYDFLVVESGNALAENIRRTGAYEPLNDVDGMAGFLDECHPYVKEAAMAENGNFWMLPLEVETPVLLCQEEKMQKYGLTVENLDTYMKMTEQIMPLPKDGTCLYSVPYYLMTNDIIHKYLKNYAINGNKADFHTDVFRSYLDLMRQYDERVNAGEVLFDTTTAAHGASQKERCADTLFALERSSIFRQGNKDYLHYDVCGDFHAYKAPVLEEGKPVKNQAELCFIVVNPNSRKKKWVLSYLEEVCKGIREDSGVFLLAKNQFEGQPLWQEVREIVADSEIYFAYPDEIIMEELERYRLEGQSYEDTVNEMERKMNMYLNE